VYRWLRYINISIVIAAVFILIVGLTHLPGDGTGEIKNQGQKPDRVTKGDPGKANLDDNGESPLISVVSLYSERWAKPLGSVTVKIGPQEINHDEARWRVAGMTKWRKSGETVKKISVGAKSIEFKEVAGWNPPGKIPVEVIRKKEAVISADYTLKPPPEYGKVTIDIGPEDILKLQPQWRIAEDGGWKNSGEIDGQVLVGTHKIELKKLPGWKEDKTLSVEVEKDKAVKLSVVYERMPVGSVKIVINPEEVVQAGALWRIAGGGWQKSGLIVQNIEAGKHKIEFKSIADWNVLPALEIEVAKDLVTKKTVEYEKVPLGSLVVNIVPVQANEAGAQWRIAKTKEWQKSGSQLSKIAAGEHVIEFRDLKKQGWLLPEAVNVKVAHQEVAQITVQYSKKPPSAPKFIVRGTIASNPPGAHNGFAWLRLTAKDRRDKGFFIGEVIQEYKLTQVKSGAVVLTRDGYDFVLEVAQKAPASAQKPALKNSGAKREADAKLKSIRRKSSSYSRDKRSLRGRGTTKQPGAIDRLRQGRPTPPGRPKVNRSKANKPPIDNRSVVNPEPVFPEQAEPGLPVPVKLRPDN